MGTWIQDLEKTNPKLAEAYKTVGNQDTVSLRHMVKALSMFPMLNTDEDNRRLKAARFILSQKRKTKK